MGKLSKRDWKKILQRGLNGEPISPATVKRAKGLRRQRLARPTKAEKAFLLLLQDLEYCYGIRFDQEVIVYISDEFAFLVDFYIQGFKIGIEIDGSIHDSNMAKHRDPWREEVICKRTGWQLIRFKNAEVLERPQQVCKTLIAVLLAQSVPAKWKQELLGMIEERPISAAIGTVERADDYVFV
jgi:very-short-patch-repair endonuclease